MSSPPCTNVKTPIVDLLATVLLRDVCCAGLL